MSEDAVNWTERDAFQTKMLFQAFTKAMMENSEEFDGITATIFTAAIKCAVDAFGLSFECDHLEPEEFRQQFVKILASALQAEPLDFIKTAYGNVREKTE